MTLDSVSLLATTQVLLYKMPVVNCQHAPCLILPQKNKVNSLNSWIDVFQHARKLQNCQSNMCTANKISNYSNTFTVKQYLVMSV
jgi:hypothetical protein